MNIKAGESYKTKCGEKATALCTDAPGFFPVIGFITYHQGQSSGAASWTTEGLENGKANVFPRCEDNDLVAEWTEPVTFDWSCLPAWANRFILLLQGGTWIYTQEEPALTLAGWRCYGDSNGSGKGIPIPAGYEPKSFTGDWKDSLMKNPNIQ